MKIRDAKGRRDSNSAYIRVFNNKELGALISKIQATVISNSSELERIILSQTNNIDDLDKFIEEAEAGEIEKGVFVCAKNKIKKSKYSIKNPANNKGIEPDLLVFIIYKNKICKVIE